MRTFGSARASASSLTIIKALLAPASPTAAQTVSEQPPSPTTVPSRQADQPQPTAPADEPEVVVTGSRIARPTLSSPNPITTIDCESILLSGETNLTDYLQTVPALVGSLDSEISMLHPARTWDVKKRPGERGSPGQFHSLSRC